MSAAGSEPRPTKEFGGFPALMRAAVPLLPVHMADAATRQDVLLRIWTPEDDTEVEQIAVDASLAAFGNYPLFEWVAAGGRGENRDKADAARAELAEWVARGAAGLARTRGMVVVAEDAESGEPLGSMTVILEDELPPAGWRRALAHVAHDASEATALLRFGGLPSLLRGAYGFGVLRRTVMLTRLGDEHYATMNGRKHLYLMQLSVFPTSQGSGVGTALQRFLCRVADTLGLPVYLETLEGRHVAYYQRTGFKVERTYDVMDFGGNVGMVREPQPIPSFPNGGDLPVSRR